MTKRDAKTLTWAALAAAALAGGFYWWARKKGTIYELSPVTINWESA
jgi:hypothetical protein